MATITGPQPTLSATSTGIILAYLSIGAVIGTIALVAHRTKKLKEARSR